MWVFTYVFLMSTDRRGVSEGVWGLKRRDGCELIPNIEKLKTLISRLGLNLDQIG